MRNYFKEIRSQFPFVLLHLFFTLQAQFQVPLAFEPAVPLSVSLVLLSSFLVLFSSQTELDAQLWTYPFFHLLNRNEPFPFSQPSHQIAFVMVVKVKFFNSITFVKTQLVKKVTKRV